MGLPEIRGKQCLKTRGDFRYGGRQDLIEHIVMEAVREQLVTRGGVAGGRPGQAGPGGDPAGGGGSNVTRNLLRLLTSTSGLPEVDLMVITRKVSLPLHFFSR